MSDTTGWIEYLRSAPSAVGVPVDRTAAGDDPGGRWAVAPPDPSPTGGRDRTLRWVTALAALLHRYTGGTDLVIGCRPAAGAGLLPLRVRVRPDDPVDAVAAAVDDAWWTATGLGPIPPSRLRAVRDPLGTGQYPPCHAVVTGPDAGEEVLDCADLALIVSPDGAADLRTRGPVHAGGERLARSLATLAAAAEAEPRSPVATLPTLDDDGVHRALVEWNDTDRAIPPEYFHERLADLAERTPDALAVVRGEERLTFADLDALAGRMAGHLASVGAGAGSRVGVFLERSPLNLVAQLAAFRLGATVVLLDPEYPAERLSFIAADSAAAAMVTRSGLADRLDGIGDCAVVAVDTDPAWRSAPPVTAMAPTDDEMVCHIAYTSGSTGLPKAVMLRHGPLRTLADTLGRECGITAEAEGSWLCSPGFGLVEVDCFPVLAAGGTVHIPDPEVVAAPERLRDWLVAQRITHTLVLTAMAERVWTLSWPDGAALRSMRIAGERARTWPPASLPYQVLNVYGSAEATVVAVCDLTAMARELAGADGVVAPGGLMPPIGRPVANVRTYVLDAGLNPVPPMVEGELYVSGASLSEGYLNRPEANAAKFLANPLPGDPHPVLYRSGDIARYWPDGTVEVVGRADDEVKIRGYRVQLGEVETVLAQQPGVRQAAALAREDTPGERRLVAYVEPDPTAPPSLPDVRRALGRILAPYAQPSAYVVLPVLPTTPNGKIDRAVLPPPPRTRPEVDTPFRTPGTDTERRLVVLWSGVLEIDQVGVDDDFFALGGDSLRAMRLLTGITDELGVDVGLSGLYGNPTVAGVAGLVDAMRADGALASAGLPTVAPDPAGRFEPFDLTPNQQALWIGRGDSVDLGNVGAHGYFEWEHADLDVDRFRRAWRALVDRHDMLRTVIRPDGTQVVLADVPGDGIEVLDVRDLPAEEATAAADRVRQEMSHQVIDAELWPLYDVRLTCLPDGRVRLHFGLDMLIMDAWSAFQILFPELIELYDDPAAALPPLDLTFRDCVRGASALAETPEYRRSREYWLSRLDTLPAAPDLPTVAAPAGALRFDRYEHSVDAPRWQRLKERANAAGITQNGILVAAFAEVLRGWSANERFTINFPIFDRPAVHPQIDRVLGDFTNTVLVAVDKTDGTFLDRARSVQHQLWRDLDHRYFNGVDVLRELSRRSGGSLRPAMPIVLTSLLGHPPRRYVSALGTETYGISQTPQVLLDFQVREIDGVLHFKWDHLPDLFPPGMLSAMFDAYCALVERLAGDELDAGNDGGNDGDGDTVWLAERVAMVPADQLARRAEVNRTEVAVPEVLLHDLLAEQAATRPDAPAVISSRRRLTFAELRREANRIGRDLRSRGARPGKLVAVVMDKGWEQYAAAYGILTAGAAYLPVDATVPASRLRYLLENGQVDHVLTQPWLAGSLEWPDRVQVLSVGGDDETDDDGEVDDGPLPSVQATTDLAYVIYTSGSTGEPKGVMVDHRGVVNHVLDVNRRFGISASDRALATAGLHFDMSVYDVFGILAAGGAAVLPDPSDVPDPRHWLDLVERESVTFWASVPALMEMAVQTAESAPGPVDLTSLRRVVLAGDWIPLTLPDRITTRAPRASVVSCGGPTETVNWSIWHPITTVEPTWASIPYGRPMANQRYHILDERLDPRPVWVPGRMMVSSEVGLAHGYWRDAERTADRFLEHPATGERLYATGDVGRYLPDGSIEILGRDDLQVKVQGHRIELGEIEACLQRHPKVTAATVVAPGTATGNRRLVAFLVGPAATAVETVEAVARFARAELPHYLVPPDLRVIDELPLTGNGKVDRPALERMAESRHAGADDLPVTPVEEVVGALAAEVLGLDQVPPGSDFFQLGGDSLSGIRLTSRINETFGIEMPLRRLFEVPRFRDLCAALAADDTYGAAVVALAEAFSGLGTEDLDSMLCTPVEQVEPS